MKIPFKKQKRKIGFSLLTLPLLIAGNLYAAEESVEERIKKLESMVTELKQLVKQQKVTHEKTMAKMDKKGSSKSSSGAKHSYKFGEFIKATASWNDTSEGDIGAG